MERTKKALPFYAVMILNFYLIPSFIADTVSGIIILLIVMPAICLIVSIIYGIKEGVHLIYAVITAVLFIPSIFIFYNSSAWVYSIIYGIIALLGTIISLPLRRKEDTDARSGEKENEE